MHKSLEEAASGAPVTVEPQRDQRRTVEVDDRVVEVANGRCHHQFRGSVRQVDARDVGARQRPHDAQRKVDDEPVATRQGGSG